MTSTRWQRLPRSVGWLLVVVAGCAVEANTLEPEPIDDSPSAGKGSGGAGGAGGKTSTGGKASAGSSGKGTGGSVTAFGGTSTSAGNAGDSGDGGSAGSGGVGGKTSGGQSSGGAGNGGAAGTSAGKGGGGSGGGGKGGSGGSGSHCLEGWRDNAACDTCETQTQGDKKACANVLDCYITNDCGPATCSGNTDVCGANAIQQGTAPFPIAADVYNCICK